MTATRDSALVVDVRGLTVRLPADADRAHAVEDITFAVAAGEILCIVGESGSGKSVTAQAIMGLLPRRQLEPVDGQILFDGRDLLTAPVAHMQSLRGHRMGMIFQEPMTALNPVMTVGRQIEEVLAIHTDLSRAARAERVLEIMTAVNLPDTAQLVHSYPHQLSGGQRQRVMIAMALVLGPALLIADEPTTALDVTTQAQILQLIRDIQKTHGMGVLFITHDFGVVAEIADRVAVMQAGHIVETGAARKVLTAPQHDYTRMLIGAVPSLVPPNRPSIGDSPAILSTSGLSKTYGATGTLRRTREVVAAKDVNIAVRRGETLGIVGESGSGKTTVARCLVRLVAPTGGTITIDGDDIAPLTVTKLRPYRRRIQIVFQDPYRSLNPRRAVGRSIIEGPVNYGVSVPDAVARAHDLLALVGLERSAFDRYPHQFSGGQRQRICIARALAMEPEVLIADEAVSALDVSVQAQVLDLLDDVRQRFNLAMVFITHDLRVAAQICDRIAVMYGGVVVESGQTGTVFSAPTHPYTKRLFDAAPGRSWDFAVHHAAS